jgi:hypothetical protein
VASCFAEVFLCSRRVVPRFQVGYEIEGSRLELGAWKFDRESRESHCLSLNHRLGLLICRY